MTSYDWEEKCWGRVRHIFASDRAAVSLLEVREGFQCSRHYHLARHNQFIVISGRIEVEQWFDGSSSNQPSITLGPGESCTVLSGIIHRFRVLESGSVVEVYWPATPQHYVNLSDIHRLDIGGEISQD